MAGSDLAPRTIGRLLPSSGTNTAALSTVMSAAALRILAVDNELSVTFSLRHIFNAPRYEFTSVENGDAALSRISSGSERYDVIIVDQKMPHMSGLELVGEMRKRGVTSKIMVLSADISPEVREAYERVDVHLMFPKPFDIGELRSAIDHLVT
jgi:DNA-binding response OmpR family regulator